MGWHYSLLRQPDAVEENPARHFYGKGATCLLEWRDGGGGVSDEWAADRDYEACEDAGVV